MLMWLALGFLDHRTAGVHGLCYPTARLLRLTTWRLVRIPKPYMPRQVRRDYGKVRTGVIHGYLFRTSRIVARSQWLMSLQVGVSMRRLLAIWPDFMFRMIMVKVGSLRD